MARILLPLDCITQDPRLQGRPLKDSVVESYAEAMRRFEPLPAISVVHDADDNYYLVDGYHRLAAKKQLNGVDTIEAEIIEGTFDYALWLSWGANRGHGLRRTREGIRRAIREALKHPHWSLKKNREIARHIDCDHKTVIAVRSFLKRQDSTGEFPSSKAKQAPSRAQVLKAAKLLASTEWDQLYPFEKDELAALGSARDSLSELFVANRALAA